MISIGKYRYDFSEFSKLKLTKAQQWLKPAQIFIQNWLNDRNQFEISTSGSTGKPKKICLSREQIQISATNTIKTLSLPKGTKALLCLNTEFIGGKMMLARALCGKWNIELVQPSANPAYSATASHFDFAAMAPIQVATLLKTPKGVAFLNNIDKVIIGGTPVSDQLSERIEKLKNQCYHTYGMTETASHIALKPINGPNRSDWFKVVGDNTIARDKRGCLKIKGSLTNHQWLTTNDLAEVSAHRFTDRKSRNLTQCAIKAIFS